MSDKEKVSGEEVEVSRYTLEQAGRFLYSHDEVVPALEYDRITEALRGEVARLTLAANIDAANKQCADALPGVIAERDQLRAEVDWLKAINGALDESNQRLLAQQQGVPDALREAVEYLDDNRFNSIGVGSILHRAMTDALAAAPAPVQAEPASPWVAVTERLPQIKQVLSEKCTLEGREIPTLYRSGMVLTFDGSRVSAGIIEWFHSKSPLNNVTHWMPLPAAPEVV